MTETNPLPSVEEIIRFLKLDGTFDRTRDEAINEILGKSDPQHYQKLRKYIERRAERAMDDFWFSVQNRNLDKEPPTKREMFEYACKELDNSRVARDFWADTEYAVSRGPLSVKIGEDVERAVEAIGRGEKPVQPVVKRAVSARDSLAFTLTKNQKAKTDNAQTTGKSEPHLGLGTSSAENVVSIGRKNMSSATDPKPAISQAPEPAPKPDVKKILSGKASLKLETNKPREESSSTTNATPIIAVTSEAAKSQLPRDTISRGKTTSENAKSVDLAVDPAARTDGDIKKWQFDAHQPPSMKNGAVKTACHRFLFKGLSQQRYNEVFQEPVVVDGYDKIIKYPMDLGTVAKKFNSDEYETMFDFFRDLELIWANCMHYNRHTTSFWKAAKAHSEVTQKLKDKVVKYFKVEDNKSAPDPRLPEKGGKKGVSPGSPVDDKSQGNSNSARRDADAKRNVRLEKLEANHSKSFKEKEGPKEENKQRRSSHRPIRDKSKSVKPKKIEPHLDDSEHEVEDDGVVEGRDEVDDKKRKDVSPRAESEQPESLLRKSRSGEREVQKLLKSKVERAVEQRRRPKPIVRDRIEKEENQEAEIGDKERTRSPKEKTERGIREISPSGKNQTTSPVEEDDIEPRSKKKEKSNPSRLKKRPKYKEETKLGVETDENEKELESNRADDASNDDRRSRRKDRRQQAELDGEARASAHKTGDTKRPVRSSKTKGSNIEARKSNADERKESQPKERLTTPSTLNKEPARLENERQTTPRRPETSDSETKLNSDVEESPQKSFPTSPPPADWVATTDNAEKPLKSESGIAIEKTTKDGKLKDEIERPPSRRREGQRQRSLEDGEQILSNKRNTKEEDSVKEQTAGKMDADRDAKSRTRTKGSSSKEPATPTGTVEEEKPAIVPPRDGKKKKKTTSKSAKSQKKKELTGGKKAKEDTVIQTNDSSKKEEKEEEEILYEDIADFEIEDSTRTLLEGFLKHCKKGNGRYFWKQRKDVKPDDVERIYLQDINERIRGTSFKYVCLGDFLDAYRAHMESWFGHPEIGANAWSCMLDEEYMPTYVNKLRAHVEEVERLEDEKKNNAIGKKDEELPKDKGGDGSPDMPSNAGKPDGDDVSIDGEKRDREVMERKLDRKRRVAKLDNDEDAEGQNRKKLRGKQMGGDRATNQKKIRSGEIGLPESKKRKTDRRRGEANEEDKRLKRKSL